MVVPDYQALMRPTLDVLSEHGTLQVRALTDLVADSVGLTEDDRAETIGSGKSRVGNRVAWAVTYLVQAGAVRRPQRGYCELTERGQELLAFGRPIRVQDLQIYDEFREFQRRARGSDPSDAMVVSQLTELDSTDPTELLERAARGNVAAVEGELLDRLLKVGPAAFERVVLRLLGAMGYGESGAIEHSGRSGDGGIDGVISQDPLGLDRVYMQAKRYARDNTVSRPVIQEFVGALHGVQADRGVFIATSSFTAGARDYADRVGARVILIDGLRMAALMRSYGVGVQPDTTVTFQRIDEDFFETV